jgi:2-dehydro-3-deoxyphosphogluconate aldolase/(4S)-4-hydroxy-2-oxoglutarate aldolase
MTIRDTLALAPVIPVITVERLEDAVPLGRALVAGGLPVLEVTLRTPVALEAIRRMAAEVQGAVVGAGTVLSADDLARAGDVGARFAVSPGLTESLLRADGPPVLPGVQTASDLMRGLELGLDTFKFFPAVPAGGLNMLKAFYGPFAQVRFCPTGGITPDSAPEFLKLPNVACVGGTWLAPKDAVAAGDWGRITELARAAAALTRR